MLKEDKEDAINGKQMDSAREGTSVVSGTMKTSVQNRHQKPLHPLDHQHTVVEVRRGKRTSEAGVHPGSSLDSRAEMTCKVFAPNHLVIIGILPIVNSIHLNRNVNSVISARLHKGRLKVNPAKIEKKDGDKTGTAFLKAVQQLGSVFLDTASGVFNV